jgi:FKBP-type peptidyl-prolyl cis-trans isomerase (trigger factor)
MLILKRIARQEGIEVGEKDVSGRIAEKAVKFGSTKELLQEKLENGGGIQRLKDMLLAESTLEHLMERSGGMRRE